MALTAGLVLIGLTGAPTFAEPLDDGMRAFLHRDYATAMRLLRPLAEGGDARAQQLVGFMYEFGHGVRRSSAQAAAWYRRAAEQGDDLAQSSLGVMYLNGDGVPQNNAEAMKWTLLAAKQGNPVAESSMGMIYKQGYGVPQNYILAYMWISISAHDDLDYEPAARNYLAELALHMAPSQIAEAENLAQQCIQSNYQACPPARDKVASPANRSPSHTRVPLKASGDTFAVPVEINGVMTLDFFMDSGASDVTLPADVFSTLKRTGTIKESDVVGERTYLLADGSERQSTTFTIRSLRVGDMIVENVRASVPPVQGPLLLGQSFLKRFKSWSIDNATQELLLEAR